MLCNKMSTEEMLSSDDQRRKFKWSFRKRVGAHAVHVAGKGLNGGRAGDLDLLLQEMVVVDELAWCSHAVTWHHRHGLHAAEALTHASR